MAAPAGMGLLLICMSLYFTATSAAPYNSRPYWFATNSSSTRTFTANAGTSSSMDPTSAWNSITTTIPFAVSTTISSLTSTAISSPTTRWSSSPIPSPTTSLTSSPAPGLTTSLAPTLSPSETSSLGWTSTVSPVSPETATFTPIPGTLRLNLVNNLEQGQVHAYLTGMDSNNELVMLTNEGEFYYPSSTTSTPQDIPSSADVALNLNGAGETTVFTIPQYITSARLWVSQGTLQFGVTSTGLVEPSAANPADPNHNTNWGFMELTFQDAEDGGIYANLSFVDFLGLPLGMKITGSPNVTQSALGPHKDAVQTVCQQLKEQAKKDGQPWHKLCKYDDKGNLIRVISPPNLIGEDPSAFDKYFDDYVEAVWQQYSETPLMIQTQSTSGLINCTSSSGDLTCEGDDTPFTKPNAVDIFGCNSGSFANGGNAVHLAAIPRVCAAFNRATLHLPGGNVQPSLPPSHWYAAPANNWYAAFVHKVELDSKGYGFSYDDVTPDMSEYNPAGLLSMPEPELLTVYIGGYKDGQ